jgi:hypothetical protein
MRINILTCFIWIELKLVVLFFNSFEYFMEYFCFRLYDLLDFQPFLKVFFFAFESKTRQKFI